MFETCRQFSKSKKNIILHILQLKIFVYKRNLDLCNLNCIYFYNNAFEMKVIPLIT